MHLVYTILLFTLIVHCGRRTFAFVLEDPEHHNHLSENLKLRSSRDVGAATWPHVYEFDTFIRTSRNSELQNQEATILIEGFWRNYGKSESEIEVLDNENTMEQIKKETQEKEFSNSQNSVRDNDQTAVQRNLEENASFRFSTVADPEAYTGNGKVESQQRVSPQQTQYPLVINMNPNDHVNNLNLQYSGYPLPHPHPPYSVSLPQSFGPGNLYAAGNVFNGQNTQVQSPYKPAGYTSTTQSYPATVPYPGIYGLYNGLPLTSTPLHLQQKLPLDTSYPEHGSVYPQTPMLSRSGIYTPGYFPSKSGVPQPPYAFVPFNSLSQNLPASSYQASYPPNPNVFVKSESQTVPSYPYSSPSS